MIKTIMTQMLAVFALIMSSAVLGQTQVPHIFQSGQPARAAEVNDNFSTLESAANQNADDIATNADGVAANTASIGNFTTLQWLANGQPVGSVVSASELLTFSDYGLSIERSENRVEKIVGIFWFVSLGCVGQPYVTGGLTNSAQGKVFQSPHESDPIRLYYYPQGSTPIVDIVFLSHSDATTGCIDQTSAPIPGLPALANDPAITGVATEFFDLPLIMGHR